MRIGLVKYQNSLLERRNVFHFTQTPELYLAFSKMYTLVTPRGQLGKNLNFLKRVLRSKLHFLSLILSVFLSFFLTLSCTQYQLAYKNVLFIIILSKMSKDNY